MIEGSLQVADSLFGSNGADNGGGIFAGFDAIGTVDGCTFEGNTAQFSGGGIMLNNDAQFSIGNSFFGTNGAQGNFEGGGGVFVFAGAHATIFNCVFSDNRGDFGGGMDVYQATSTVINSTFSRNRSDVDGGNGGGGLENSASITSIVNCIFRDNLDVTGPNQLAQVLDLGMVTSLGISHSNVQSGQVGIDSCANCDLNYEASNLDADPLFVDADGDDDRDGTPDDNLRLLAGSPCIDAGTNGAVIAILTDFDGNARVFNTVDMGAFEDFLDCNSNFVPDAGDLMDFNQDGAIDLADFQAFQLCFGDASIPCLAVFDLALDCGVIDLNDFEVLFGQYTGPSAGMMMLLDGGDHGEETMTESEWETESVLAEPEAAPECPWTMEDAELEFELQPLGGGTPLTALQPYTSYELNYDAKANGVTSSILASLAASAAEGLADADPAYTGVWSDTGNFLFEAFTDEEMVPDPQGSGLYRTTWTRDEAVLTGEAGSPAPSSGVLHIITTGDEGSLVLEVYMDYLDEDSGIWVNMQASRMYQVED